jgi:chromate transporter
MIYLDLFLGFLKVGLFSFGGAYGAIPLIKDVVLHYKWIDEEQLANIIAISESTPGPIMVNLATYVGSIKGGILGAAIATLAVVLPAFFIILIVMFLLKKILANPYTQAVLRGIKPCIIGIILATGIYMLVKNSVYPLVQVNDVMPLILVVVLTLIYYGSERVVKKKISPIMLIIISACLGIIVWNITPLI